MFPCGYLHSVAIWQQHRMEYLSRQELSVCAALAVLSGLASGVAVSLPLAFATALLAFLMAAITISDLRHYIIPDVFSLPAIPCGIAAMWLVSGPGSFGNTVALGVLGALLGGASLYAVKTAYFWWKGIEGLGLGDVKLAAAAGAWLGPEYLAVTLLLACLGALTAVLVFWLVLKHNVTGKTALPFGAFIAPAIWLVWVYQQFSQSQ